MPGHWLINLFMPQSETYKLKFSYDNLIIINIVLQHNLESPIMR
jgi:hypothetical protein